MAEGIDVRIRLYVPADPIGTDEGVTVQVSAEGRQRTRLYVDPTMTRAQLVTKALTDVRTYVLSIQEGQAVMAPLAPPTIGTTGQPSSATLSQEGATQESETQ